MNEKWVMTTHSTNQFLPFQVELAEICAKSERYIGTEGGGMDQSISFLAEEGTVGSIPNRNHLEIPSGKIYMERKALRAPGCLVMDSLLY